MNRIASVLAFVIGAMSIVAGGMAIRGWDPGYSVLGWLPVYNFVVGALTLIPAILLWRNRRQAPIASISIFVVHAIVTALLFTAFRGAAARESIAAMSFRLAVWLTILALMFLQSRRSKTKTVLKSI
jgi:hypothetical protein